MSALTTDASAPVELRPLLHAEVDRLSDAHLGLAHRLLLEIELHQLTGELDDAADAARGMSKLTLESIAGAVATHRARLPYGS